MISIIISLFFGVVCLVSLLIVLFKALKKINRRNFSFDVEDLRYMIEVQKFMESHPRE